MEKTTQNERPAFDFNSLTDYEKERLIKATLNLYKRIIQQPGGRAKIEQKIEQMREENARK